MEKDFGLPTSEASEEDTSGYDSRDSGPDGGLSEQRDPARQIVSVGPGLAATAAIEGTVAEDYLTKECCIPRPDFGWPDALRFDPISAALVAIATSEHKGPPLALWVDVSGRRLLGRSLWCAPPKSSAKDAALRFPGAISGPLMIAGTIESGLSVWASTLCETLVPLNGMGSITPPVGRKVVVCLDDQRRYSNRARKVREAVSRWQRLGISVTEAKPWATRRQDNSTFNDLLRSCGSDAVAERITKALDPGVRSSDPMPLEAARERLDQLIAKEGDAVLAGSKRGATAIGVEAGTGKTRRAHLEVVRVVRALREKGDTRCVVIATPRHDLNDEQAKRIQAIAADIDVRVFRGANAPDPTNPEMTMCRQVDAHNAAVSRKLEPKKTVCPVCPFRAGCAYREQARSRADVWIVPHSLLFLPKPAPIGIPAWVIVDENPISAALFGTGVDPGKNAVNGPLTLSLDTLCRRDTVRGSPIETDRLMDIRTRLRRALEASANGRMTRSALIAEGLTADDFAEAIKLEYKTGIRPALGCALSLSERLETLKAADANRDLERRVILMREAGRLLRQNIYRESGRISVGSISSEDGSVRVVRMKGLRRITEEWRVRTMVIDATLQENLLRSLWWNITVKRMGPVAAPHRHIAQVIDRAFSLAMLDAGAPR